jgi:hypothetical protein
VNLTLEELAVNSPPHYASGSIECIDAIREAVAGLSGEEAYCTGNAIKYLWRWKRKGGKQDLEKARWYINRLLDHGLDDNAAPIPSLSWTSHFGADGHL